MEKNFFCVFGNKISCVLGTGKLQLHAIVPMLLEKTAGYVFVTTTSERLRECREIVAAGDENTKYGIWYVADDVKNLDEVKRKLDENGIRVAIVKTTSAVYTELFRACDGGYYHSACRDGILSYIHDIIEASTKPTEILCYDNDSNIVDMVRLICKGTVLSVYKCVAHAVCSSTEVDEKGKRLILYGNTEKYIFYPHQTSVKKVLNRKVSLGNSRIQVRFAPDQDTFDFLVKAKAVDVNAMHTALCVLAYKEGAKQKIPPEEVEKMRFSDLIDKKEDVMHILEAVHSTLFDKILLETANRIGEEKKIHTHTAYVFVKYLFDSEHETVCRGLSISNRESAISKAERHFPILMKAENEILEALDYFKKILY
ncbi:MAG: hypothetical protein IJZ55_08860 [Lachnospiraceae bacterium]|nr:hypothetical protein [Lachnospiraceae bacterium]